jgi:phosphoglycolate phosphatase-like HAD superfamily hydrolase
MVDLTLLTRADCHLCTEARQAVIRVAEKTITKWTEIDIATDTELAYEYGDRVPVVLLNGKEHGFWRVEEDRLISDITRLTKNNRRHLVWDWNGTLFDDAEAILAATNDIFAPAGITITADTFKAIFTRPLTHFYQAIVGRPITEPEFHQFDTAFHNAYHIRMQQCTMAADAEQALDMWAAAGHTQSILSMWTHNDLYKLVNKLGITPRFLAVEGRYGSNLGSKAAPLRKHLSTLGITPEKVTVIGDSLDDAAAAQAVGTKCILYDGGAHEVKALQQTGCEVAPTLTAAVTNALQH